LEILKLAAGSIIHGKPLPVDIGVVIIEPLLLDMVLVVIEPLPLDMVVVVIEPLPVFETQFGN
jgi:hypothetical protein